ncbi:hypothetical protein B0H17DRAFT_1198046 [Mycena rosella]|uniref:Uncharacterized protein n=1 Tax=Mycena rosella TaxID=1033263 RepID=A0AAD7DS95_MYCRO|nr:hypothetical protein B0H17DRAFT_1198046 [Mycena rosella]
MQQFAQELVDYIIDDVAAAATTNEIATCSSVCPRWLPRSRKHLFHHITVSQTTLLQFLDSSPHLLPFVRSLDIRIKYEPFAEPPVAQLQNFSTLVELCIHAPAMLPAEQLDFECWLQTAIQGFGAACPNLTRFELTFASDITLPIIADIMSGLPRLTHLRLDGGKANGITQSAGVLPAGAFPPQLHSLDLNLRRGTSLLFEWLVAHDAPPIFTSLALKGYACSARTAPIDAYLERFGRKIETLSLAYWVDADCDLSSESFTEQTRLFEAHALEFTPALEHLTLLWQHPATLPATLTLLSSARLFTVTMQLCNTRDGDWPQIDAILASPRFASLQRLVFTETFTETDEESLKELMPLASARRILQ